MNNSILEMIDNLIYEIINPQEVKSIVDHRAAISSGVKKYQNLNTNTKLSPEGYNQYLLNKPGETINSINSKLQANDIN